MDYYDAEHDPQALLRPAWLAPRWCRNLVTPQRTHVVQILGTLTPAKVFQLCEPFNDPEPDPSMHIGRSQGGDLHPAIPAGPHLQYATVHVRARLGLRVQQRYGINPDLWQARWHISRA